MTESFELTLRMLRSALWEVEAPPLSLSVKEWDAVFDTACAQGVETLIFDAFHPGCVPPQPLLARWLIRVENVEKDFERKRRVQDELIRFWTANGIRHSVLKGQSIARFYPHPSHRLSGDIDFYFPDAESWEKAKRLAHEMASVSSDSDGDLHYLWKNVVVEHHRHWNHVSSQKDDGEVDVLVMLASHILRHSMIGGAGLRQLADFAVASHALDEACDKMAFASRMRRLGLEKWGGLLSAVMNVSFGVLQEELAFPPDAQHLDAYLALVEKDGNLGRSRDSLFSDVLLRTSLFVAICPRECFARWKNLAWGRLKRIFSSRKK